MHGHAITKSMFAFINGLKRIAQYLSLDVGVMLMKTIIISELLTSAIVLGLKFLSAEDSAGVTVGGRTWGNCMKSFQNTEIRSWNSTNLEAVVDFYPGEWLRERSSVCGKWVYIRLVSESYFSFTSMGFFVVIGFDLSKTEYETSKTVPEYKVTYVVSGVALFFVFGAFYSFLGAAQCSARTEKPGLISLYFICKQISSYHKSPQKPIGV
ncbi:hypothetical protein J6590_056612 [Homalodisca vitripennis]|nr:hypothetical protein J6590_056612 [Homalodisca vitripennis]